MIGDVENLSTDITAVTNVILDNGHCA